MTYRIIQQLEATSKSTEKLAILQKHSSDDTLRTAFQFAYNKQIHFGITKTPEYSHTFTPELTLADAFKWMAQHLVTRQLTGNAAINGLGAILSKLDAGDVEIIRRVLKGDLDCGVGQGTIDKVWPGMCPRLPQQLAQSENDELIDKIIATECAVAELKADGARSITEIHDGKIRSFTRAWNVYHGLDRINAMLKATGFDDWVVDGEFIYAPKRVPNDLSFLEDDAPMAVADRQNGNGILNKSLKGTISKEEADCVIYQVWDIIPHDVYFGKAKSVETLRERRKNLQAFVDAAYAAGFDNIEIMKQHPVKSREDAKKWYRHYHGLGFEGTILKTLNNVWSDTRTDDYVKFKEKSPIDCEIVGIYPHKKDPTKLGGVTVRTADGLMECDCGSGFKDTAYKKVKGEKVFIPLEERDELDRSLLMALGPKIIGMIVQLEANGLVKRKKVKPGEAPYKLYLPIIKHFRHDKTEANRCADVFNMSRVKDEK